MTEIAILLPPFHQNSAVSGLQDLFQIANLYAQKFAKDQSQVIRVTQWKLSSAKSKPMECVADTHPEEKAYDPSYVIVPPSLNQIISTEEAANWIESILDMHSQGVVIFSVCSGAFLLGETGLLNGRSATTHWFFHELFSKRFPSVLLDVDKLIIDEGDVMTAGGLMAWIDLGLRLIDRLMGPTIMLQTAQFMLVDPTGREQRHYGHFNPPLHHGDASILKAQHWLQKNIKEEINIEILAKKAGLTSRTFLRRFHGATGENPTAYCQKLRMNKAREFLELSKKNVDEISWEVGYEDPGAFRKTFFKVVGLTPREYRMKFQVK